MLGSAHRLSRKPVCQRKEEKGETFVLRHLTQIKSSQMGRQRFINALKNLSKLCLVHHFQFFQDKQFTLPPRHISRTVEPPPQTEANLIFRAHFWLVNPEKHMKLLNGQWIIARAALLKTGLHLFPSLVIVCYTVHSRLTKIHVFQAAFAVNNYARPWFKWKSFFKITQRFFSKGLQHKVGGHFFFRMELSAHCSRCWQSHSIQPKCLLYRADAPRWGHGDLSQISKLKYNRYKNSVARRWDSWLLERFLKASISSIFQYRPITKKKKKQQNERY